MVWTERIPDTKSDLGGRLRLTKKARLAQGRLVRIDHLGLRSHLRQIFWVQPCTIFSDCQWAAATLHSSDWQTATTRAFLLSEYYVGKWPPKSPCCTVSILTNLTNESDRKLCENWHNSYFGREIVATHLWLGLFANQNPHLSSLFLSIAISGFFLLNGVNDRVLSAETNAYNVDFWLCPTGTSRRAIPESAALSVLPSSARLALQSQSQWCMHSFHLMGTAYSIEGRAWNQWLPVGEILPLCRNFCIRSKFIQRRSAFGRST